MMFPNLRGAGGMKMGAAAAAIVVAGSLYGTAATAGPVVMSWNFQIDNGFTAFTQFNPPNNTAGDVTGTNSNSFLASTGHPNFSILSWGSSAGDGSIPANPQSSLDVSNGDSGHFGPGDVGYTTILTDTTTPPNNPPLSQAGTTVPTIDVIHKNNLVDYPTLETATLLDVLRLQPATVDAFPVNPVATGLDPNNDAQYTVAPPLAFLVHFTETPNVDDPGSCPNPQSGAGTETKGCDDIFVIEIPTGVTVVGNIIQQAFAFDSNLYEADIALAGLGVLDPQNCSTAGAAIGCIGFLTHEDQDNSFRASLGIRFLGPVPEPGTLAILGVGLLGLGYTRRRKAA